MLLHKVIVRTDVWLGERDGESMWETVDSRIMTHGDEGIRQILEAHACEREDVPVQQIVIPDGEGQMTVIEIHYAQECEHDWVDVSYHEMACNECGAVRVRL